MSLVARASALFNSRPATVKAGPIGVDIALEAIHLVQLEQAETGDPAVRAKVSLPLGSSRDELLLDPQQFRALIKRAFACGNFQGNKIVLALPSILFRTVSINYQHAGSEKGEAAAVLRVMKDRLDGELSDYVLDYVPVRGRPKSDEKLAIVAVSERNKVVNFLELARRAGLDVTALEIGPLAISRLTQVIARGGESSTVLVVNSGQRASYLTLISGGDLLFDQEVSVGEHSLVTHVCETLDMPQDTARRLLSQTGVGSGSHNDPVTEVIDESGLYNTLAEILKPQFLRLVEEIKRAFLYAASETRGSGVTQVYLLGSIARWPGAEQLLSSLCGSQVQTIPDPIAMFPSRGEDGAAMASHSAPEIAVATGLALRGMKFDG